VSIAVKDNSRYGSLQFDVDVDTVLHGFGGYFYCVLYADISFSTSHPATCLLSVVLLLSAVECSIIQVMMMLYSESQPYLSPTLDPSMHALVYSHAVPPPFGTNSHPSFVLTLPLPLPGLLHVRNSLLAFIR